MRKWVVFLVIIPAVMLLVVIPALRAIFDTTPIILAGFVDWLAHLASRIVSAWGNILGVGMKKWAYDYYYRSDGGLLHHPALYNDWSYYYKAAIIVLVNWLLLLGVIWLLVLCVSRFIGWLSAPGTGGGTSDSSNGSLSGFGKFFNVCVTVAILGLLALALFWPDHTYWVQNPQDVQWQQDVDQFYLHYNWKTQTGANCVQAQTIDVPNNVTWTQLELCAGDILTWLESHAKVAVVDSVDTAGALTQVNKVIDLAYNQHLSWIDPANPGQIQLYANYRQRVNNYPFIQEAGMREAARGLRAILTSDDGDYDGQRKAAERQAALVANALFETNDPANMVAGLTLLAVGGVTLSCIPEPVRLAYQNSSLAQSSATPNASEVSDNAWVTEYLNGASSDCLTFDVSNTPPGATPPAVNTSAINEGKMSSKVDGSTIAYLIIGALFLTVGVIVANRRRYGTMRYILAIPLCSVGIIILYLARHG